MKRGLIFLILTLLIFPLASAEIFITQPKYTYNIGDNLNVDITLNPSSTINDFLEADLVCAGESISLHKSPQSLNANEEKVINVNIDLDNNLIEGALGTCQITATHGEESSQTQEFQLTKGIEINLDLQTKRFNPGETITLTGQAIKLNGEALNGFIEADIGFTDLNLVQKVTEGTFTMSITLPQNSPPGSHNLQLKAYDKDPKENINNEGLLIETIEITQVFKSIEIELDSETIFPGSPVNFKAIAYDQTGSAADKEVSLIIYSPNQEVILKKLVNSNEEQIFETQTHDSPGYWKVEASSGELVRKKLYYLEENQQIETQILDNILIITNIGNVPYKKAIEVSIGSGNEIKDLNIPVGGISKFKLSAPSGEYGVKINDGEEIQEFNSVALTGRAIDVGEIREGLASVALGPLGWLLGALIIILLIVIIYSKRLKSKIKEKLLLRQKKLTTAAVPSKTVVQAGTKEEAIAVTIAIKNKLTPLATQNLDSALMNAKKVKANIYVDGNYRVLLFAPSLTKIQDNSLIAVTAAKSIEKELKEYNSKFKDKIDFGIGINNGEIISETNMGKFKFATKGNIIPLAKKIAAQSNSEVFLSDSMHQRSISTVKSQKAADKDAWRVTKVTDRTQHQDFINTFKQNQNKN